MTFAVAAKSVRQLSTKLIRLELKRWQWILLCAIAGAVCAVLVLEVIALFGHLTNEQWLRDVGINVTGPTASAGGAAAGGGAAASGVPTGGKDRGGPPVTDPHGPRGETPEQRAEREFNETQQKREVLDDLHRRQDEHDTRQRDLNPPPTPRQQTLSDVYKKRY